MPKKLEKRVWTVLRVGRFSWLWIHFELNLGITFRMELKLYQIFITIFKTSMQNILMKYNNNWKVKKTLSVFVQLK